MADKSLLVPKVFLASATSVPELPIVETSAETLYGDPVLSIPGEQGICPLRRRSVAAAQLPTPLRGLECLGGWALQAASQPQGTKKRQSRDELRLPHHISDFPRVGAGPPGDMTAS